MPSIKALLKLLQGDDRTGWLDAGQCGRQLVADPRAVEAVCDVLQNGKHELQRYEAAYILGSAYSSRQAGQALYDSFQSAVESAEVRGICAEQLAYHDGIRRGKLIAAYLNGLDDPSPNMRFWCIYGLASRRAPEARAKLQQLAATDHVTGAMHSKVSTEAKFALAVFDNLPLRDRVYPGPFRKPEPIRIHSPTVFLRRAIEVAANNVRDGNGGPFGAVIVRGKDLIAEGANRVVLYNDPTAHAEIVAIREAARTMQTFDLTGCEIYCSCEPNLMSLGAIYWARLSRIYYAASREDAARAGFIAERSLPTRNMSRRAGRAPFAAWNKSAGKIRY